MAVYSGEIDVSTGTDDGFYYYNSEAPFNTGFDNTAPYLLFGDDNAFSGAVKLHYNAFMRFDNVPIPQGSIVNSANIRFGVAQTNIVPASGIIRAVDGDDESAPANYTAASTASLTSAAVMWEIPISGALFLRHYTSPNIASVIQEIVDRPGWSSGNAIVVYVKDTFATPYSTPYVSGLLAVGSYEGQTFGAGFPSGEPQLHWEIGTVEPTQFTDDMEFFISGGNTPSGSIDLYMSNINTDASGMSLFIGQNCYDAIYPSGDIGHTPSGHIINSDGGSGIFWSYINNDPQGSFVDNGFLNVFQSGHVPYPQSMFFTDYDIIQDNIYCKKLRIADNAISVFESGLTDSVVSNDAGNSILYLAKTNDLIAKKTDFDDIDGTTIFAGLGSSFTTIDILINNRNNLIYLVGRNASATVDSIYAYDFQGNFVSHIYTFPANFSIISIKYNLARSHINYIYSRIISGNTFYYFTSLRLSDDGQTQQGFATPTLLGTNEVKALDIDYRVNRFYIAGTDTVIGYSGCNAFNTTVLIGPVATISNSSIDITSVAVDSTRQKLYVAYSDLTANSGLINSYDIAFGGPTFGTNMAFAYAVSGTIPSSLTLDRSIYKTTIDFQLEDLTPTYEGASENQMVSDAEVIILGKENRSSSDAGDLTHVTAKILTSDRQSLIWSLDYADPATFSGVAQSLGSIGYGSSSVNQAKNSRNDWAGAILRLDVVSMYGYQPSGNFNLYAAKVNTYCSGSFTDPLTDGGSGAFDMFITGNETSTEATPLFVSCSGRTETLDLYIGAFNNESGLMTLYTQGHIITPDPNDEPSGIPLFIGGIFTDTEEMPLFMKVITPVAVNDDTTIFMWSSLVPATYNLLDMFVKSEENSGVPDNEMVLYMPAGGHFDATSYMNLFLKINTPSSLNQTTLFVANNNLGFNSGVPLTMYGPQIDGASGWYPYDDNMILYIARPTDTWARIMELYVAGPSGETNSIPMYIAGNITNSGIPLVMYNEETPHSGIPLYSHGF